MSKAMFIFIGVTVANNPTYYPAHINSRSGKYVNPKAIIPIYVNRKRRPGDQDTQKKNTVYNLTLWNEKQAAVAAHWMTRGKLMTFWGDEDGVRLQMVDGNGNPIQVASTGREKNWGDPNAPLYPAGVQIPKWYWKYNWTIDGWEFHGDSMAADQEKPQGWNVPGTPGHQTWQQHVANLRASMAAGYQGGSTFGLAKVGQVNGQIARKNPDGSVVPITVTYGQPTGSNVVQPQYNATAQAQPQVVTNPAMMAAGAGQQFVQPVQPNNMQNPVVTSAPTMTMPQANNGQPVAMGNGGAAIYDPNTGMPMVDHKFAA